EPYAYYACTRHHLRGDSVCGNRLQMHMATADAEVLAVLEQDVLNPEAIRLAMELTVERYRARPGDIEAQRAALQADLRRAEREIERLMALQDPRDPLASVREKIREHERRLAECRARLEHLDGLAKMPRIDTGRLTAELH